MDEKKNIQPSDEAALVHAVQAGDNKAFEALVDLHLDAVRAFIALKLAAPQLVNEIAHGTFSQAYERIEEHEAGSGCRAWLNAIAMDLVRAELQRFRREHTSPLGLARAQLLETELAQPTPEVEHFRECLKALPSAMKELLTLKYKEEMAVGPIAVRFVRTHVAIWQMLFRLREQLRLCAEAKLAKSRE